jgi:hypothetical protein
MKDFNRVSTLVAVSAQTLLITSGDFTIETRDAIAFGDAHDVIDVVSVDALVFFWSNFLLQNTIFCSYFLRKRELSTLFSYLMEHQ